MRLLLLLLSCLLANMLDAQTSYVMYPAINSDGTKIAFSYQGDIWAMDTDGTAPRRLTIHPAYESRPQWSPDGQHIVYQSSRYNNADILS